MKKIILGMAVLVALSLSAFTTVEPINTDAPINTAIVKQFKLTYPAASNVKWSQFEDFYQVHFTQGEIRSIIYFNNQDQIFRTLRYYGEDQLPPFITLKIKEHYKNKDIKNVTELSDVNRGLYYEIVVEDSKNIIIVKSDDHGNLETVQKMKKSL